MAAQVLDCKAGLPSARGMSLAEVVSLAESVIPASAGIQVIASALIKQATAINPRHLHLNVRDLIYFLSFGSCTEIKYQLKRNAD
jgi:hypothetical protein